MEKSPNQTGTALMEYDEFLERMPADAWKMLPHTYAAVMSDGAWKPYNYLVAISHIISTAIGMGGGRIAISVPPRHGKSVFISDWLPTWFIDRWPEKRVILSTYEANFAMSWGRKVRNHFRDDPRTTARLAEDATSAAYWSTTKGGGMVTAGVGGPITGKGGDLIIVDDPHKNWAEAHSSTAIKMVHEWFDSTLYTRLEPGGTIVILHTRWAEDDLIGYTLTEKADDGWYHIRMPALAEEDDVLGRQIGEALCPERYDEKALSRIKTALGETMWAALFQQRPAPMEGTTFLRDWWKFYRTAPQCRFILQSWDTASKKNKRSAYTAGQTWGVTENGAVLLDRVRKKMEFPELRQTVESKWKAWRPNIVLIEDRDTGQALIQQLRTDTLMPIVAIYPDLDKDTRAQAISPMVEAGKVWLPAITPETRWVDEFINTAATFPNCLYKDEIDAMSQALGYIMTMATGGRSGSSMPRRTTKLLEGFRRQMKR